MKPPSTGKTLLWRLVSVLGISIAISVAISALVIMGTMPTVSTDISRRVAEFQTDVIVTSFRERFNTANWFHIGRDLSLLNKNSKGLIRIHIYNHFDRTFIPPLPEGFQGHGLVKQLQDCILDDNSCSKVVTFQDAQSNSYIASFDYHRSFANDKIAVITILNSNIFAKVEKSLLSILVLLSLFLLILQASVFALVTGHWIVRPIKRITKILMKNSVSELKEEISDTHEIAVLENKIVEYFDAMNHQQIRNISLERDAAIVQITKNIVHDLRAPLGTFERLLQTSDKSMPSMRDAVKDSLNRLNSMIESLRHSEVENLVKRSKSHINFLFGRESLQSKADDHHIDLQIPWEDPGEVWIDPLKVERAWMNLASNAIEAAHSLVRVEAEKVDTSLFIRVIDDGPGVPEDFLPKLFQRGATHGKQDGTGLGLAYVRQIMRGHGGDVTYRRENNLTIFECTIPNAVLPAGEYSLKHPIARPPSEDVSNKKIVAMQFKPESLNLSLLSSLTSLGSEKFYFSSEYEGSDVVATNDPDLALTAIEEGKEPLEFKASLQEAAILDRLTRRFYLV